MTVREAAAELGISGSKIRQLCRTRKISHFRYGDRIVITSEQLAAYRDSCLVVSEQTEEEAKWLAYLSSPSPKKGVGKKKKT